MLRGIDSRSPGVSSNSSSSVTSRAGHFEGSGIPYGEVLGTFNVEAPPEIVETAKTKSRLPRRSLSRLHDWSTQASTPLLDQKLEKKKLMLLTRVGFEPTLRCC